MQSKSQALQGKSTLISNICMQINIRSLSGKINSSFIRLQIQAILQYKTEHALGVSVRNKYGLSSLRFLLWFIVSHLVLFLCVIYWNVSWFVKPTESPFGIVKVLYKFDKFISDEKRLVE